MNIEKKSLKQGENERRGREDVPRRDRTKNGFLDCLKSNLENLSYGTISPHSKW
jgi:hypothetical protein